MGASSTPIEAVKRPVTMKQNIVAAMRKLRPVNMGANSWELDVSSLICAVVMLATSSAEVSRRRVVSVACGVAMLSVAAVGTMGSVKQMDRSFKEMCVQSIAEVSMDG